MLGLTTPFKLGLFASYIVLWVGCHLLVYSSQLAGAPAYNVTSVVLLTEMTKLVIAISMYITKNGSAAQMAHTAAAHPDLLLKYFIPALLYCIYNNLVYVNLESFDPGTYNVLMQLKIVLTGVVYQIIFTKRLNRNQWIGIVLITVGAMFKEAGKIGDGLMATHASGWISLVLQMLCSVAAGVYNEALLKGESDPRVTTNLQNAFMYFQSIVCNVGILCVQGGLGEAISLDNVSAVFTPSVLIVIAIMSSVGLITGYFLEHLDSVVKAVAGALEIIFTVLLSFLVFGVPLTPAAIGSAVVVFFGVALYSQPVKTGTHAHESLGMDEVDIPSVVGKQEMSAEMETRPRAVSSASSSLDEHDFQV